MTDLQRLVASATLILAHTTSASPECQGEELGIFNAKITNMLAKDRKAILDIGYFYIVSSGKNGEKFWNTTEQREDGDYFSYDENLKVISEGEE